jgi:MoaA/NifB/PqqE/SkfB family radical SAM enzyme
MFDVPSTVVADKPINVLFSITDVCNLTCVQCPHIIPGVRWVHSRVTPEKVHDVLAGATQVSLHGAGEVLMHPHWHSYVPQPSSYERNIGFVTNGLLFTPKNVELLMAHKIAYLDISMDAGSEEVYGKIRGGDWARLWDGIDRVIAARAGGPYPKLIANITLMMANIWEVARLIPILKAHQFTHLHVFHLNKLGEDEAKAWKYRFNSGSGDFTYWDQQCTLPVNQHAHDTAMTAAARVAKRESFLVACSGLFFGKQGFAMPLHELVKC